MADKPDKREFVEQKINEADAGVYAYDKALVEDLRARFSYSPVESQVNKNVQIGSPNNMFRILGSLEEDNVIMPFISLERTDWQLNLDRQGFQTFVGDMVYTRLDNKNTPVEVRAQTIPITINYRLSVWSTDRITNDALCREILFYYHLRPSLMVYVGHGINMKHKFNIYFNSGIEDNSDIANFDTNGTYFRQDMTLYTDDAYLWRANWQNKVAISPNITFDYGVDKGQIVKYERDNLDL
jgi:hypothetical protein